MVDQVDPVSWFLVDWNRINGVLEDFPTGIRHTEAGAVCLLLVVGDKNQLCKPAPGSLGREVGRGRIVPEVMEPEDIGLLGLEVLRHPG